MADINLPFGASSDRRPPTTPELAAGFACGPADIELFNWLMRWLTGHVATAVDKAGLTVDDEELEGLTAAIRSHELNFAVAGGTANALAVALDPAPASYSEMRLLLVQIATTNTGAATINVNGLGAADIVRADGTPLQRGDLFAGEVVTLLRQGDDWQVAGLLTTLIGASRLAVFQSSGTFNVPAGITRLKRVRCWGAGGGGGWSGGASAVGAGGAAGAYGEIYDVAVTPGAAIAVTVGASGTWGTAGTPNGGAGGSSSFGGVITRLGGEGGGGGASGVFTPGSETASGAIVNGFALPGGRGYQGSLAGAVLAGPGGASPFGGGSTVPTSTSAGPTGNAPGGGGGGGGALAGGLNGGPGANGLVIVEY